MDYNSDINTLLVCDVLDADLQNPGNVVNWTAGVL
jgi:hypothetical protein